MTLPPPKVMHELLDLALWIWRELVAGREPGQIDLPAQLRRTSVLRQAALERARKRVGGG